MRPEKQIGFSNINDSLIVINQRKAIIDLLIGVTVPSQDVVHCHWVSRLVVSLDDVWRAHYVFLIYICLNWFWNYSHLLWGKKDAVRVLSTGLANIVRIGHNQHLTLKPNINMNLPFHKRNEYLQRKYHQFKNIESAEQQTIYYIYYSTVVCFSIGILADLCVYLMRNNLLLAICNILSLGLFALFTYLLIRKKARIVSLLNSVFYTTGFHFRKTPHGHNPIPLTGFTLPGHRTLYIVRPLPYEFSQPDGSLYFSSGNARQVTGNIAKHAPAKKKDDFRTKAMGGFQRPAPSTQQQRNTILLPDIGEQNDRRDSWTSIYSPFDCEKQPEPAPTKITDRARDWFTGVFIRINKKRFRLVEKCKLKPLYLSPTRINDSTL